MPTSTAPLFRNGLLAKVPARERDILLGLSTPVSLPLRQVLQTPDCTVTHGYFIESGMVSIVAVLRDGESIEVGLVGSEGFIGLPILLGAERAPTEAIVQLSGTALRIEAGDVISAFEENPVLRQHLLRYVQAMYVQVTQTAACNGRHELEQRLARWLLMVDDKYQIRPVPLTQEFLGMMLGVRRQQVSLAAKALQESGLITYHHGQIDLINRGGLEAVACECYGTVAREFARLL